MMRRNTDESVGLLLVLVGALLVIRTGALALEPGDGFVCCGLEQTLEERPRRQAGPEGAALRQAAEALQRAAEAREAAADPARDSGDGAPAAMG